MPIDGSHILDSIPLGVLVTDLSGTITNANQAAATLLQREMAALKGYTLQDITIEDYYSADETALRTAGSGTTPVRYVKEVITLDGESIPVEIHAGPVRDENGAVTHIVFVIKPLSEEMQLLNQLQRRNVHLIASSEVAKAATQILDIDDLLNECVDLIRIRFGFYYAAIFLIDESGQEAVLSAATGDAGKQLMEQGHSLGVGSKSMVGWVTANNAARIALDVGEEAIRFDNPLLPKTRAEMALPLRVRGNVIGALDVQSTTVNAFTAEDIQTIQMMADQVAIAIDNARLFRR
jgi:PAS domain S-box-containing protein